MISRDSRVEVGLLRDRPVASADIVASLRAPDGGVRLVARDATTGQFAGVPVRSATRPAGYLPGIADEAVIRLFALSPDGRRLLFGDPDIGRNRLSLHTLATGTGVTLPPGPGDGANAAAFTPDGNRIAALVPDGSGVRVTVLDVDGGHPRELWSTEGMTSAEAAVSWSPDGRFLAVTYVDLEDSDHTVVLDGEGTVVADLPAMTAVVRSRLGWTGDHDLLLDQEFRDEDATPPIVLVDPASGERREVPQPDHSGVLGALEGRILRFLDGGRVVSTAFDGSDPRPLLDIGPHHEITFLDAVIPAPVT